jgi:peptide/nickel transport system substrate-binding protein
VANIALVSPAEAAARYEAALQWFDTYDHLVIGNRPFFLARYDPPAQFAEIHAFRDPTYPFKPGDWYLGAAPRVEIVEVNDDVVSIGETANIRVDLTGPGVLGLQYLLVDPATGKVLNKGVAASEGGGFTVTLEAATTGQLLPGLYQLFLAAFSDEVASLTERRVDLEVS